MPTGQPLGAGTRRVGQGKGGAAHMLAQVFFIVFASGKSASRNVACRANALQSLTQLRTPRFCTDTLEVDM